MNRKDFYKIYWKLRSIIVPHLKYSQDIYEEFLGNNVKAKIFWLDLGCGHQILQKWKLNKELELINKPKSIVGIDYNFPSLLKHTTILNKVNGDISFLPFKRNTFDLITSNMVFEHLRFPEGQLKEIHRVLKKKGKLIFHTPNKWGYTTLFSRMVPEIIKDNLVNLLEGRKPEDVFQTFYKINSSAEIHRLADLANFKVLSVKLICSSPQFIIFPPILIFEMIFIKFLLSQFGRSLRTNIIAILEKN
jgi:ubiquinone/menaquinone biosynthesis C-methylase UbiE